MTAPFLHLVKTGGGPEPPSEPILLTFKRKYIVSRAIDPDYSEATVTQDELAINDFINTVGDVWPPTVQHVEQWTLDLKTRTSQRTGKPLSKSSQTSYFRHVRAWLYWLARIGAIESAPIPATGHTPKEPKPKPKALLPDEVDQLLGYLSRQGSDKAATIHQIRDYAFILLALETGMRSGELSRLEWPDIDLRNRRVIIPDEITKGSNSGGMAFFDKSKRPLIRYRAALALELRQRGIKSRLVFPSLGNKKTGEVRQASSVSAQFKRVLGRAGLSDRHHFHCLRHTAGRICAENGITISDIAKFLRHKQETTSLRYTQAGIDRVEMLVRENVFGRRREGAGNIATPPATESKPD